MTKVLVADDHPLILSSICSILVNKCFIGQEVIMPCSTSSKVLEKIKTDVYDLYILDLEFKDISGFDLIEIIRKNIPDAKIIVCTVHQEIWTINRLLEMDINGIVLKCSDNIYLENAVKTVLEGNTYMCPAFRNIKDKTHLNRKGKKMMPLTEKEMEVLKFVVDGYTTKQIAEILDKSENTIEDRRKSIFLKLEVANAVQLVRKAIQLRLVEV